MKSASIAKRQPAQFRPALQKAILETEEARTRAAYLAQPDSEAEADDWSNAEECRCPSRQGGVPCCY